MMIMQSHVYNIINDNDMYAYKICCMFCLYSYFLPIYLNIHIHLVYNVNEDETDDVNHLSNQGSYTLFISNILISAVAQ